MNTPLIPTAILRICCPDQKGIVAAVSGFVFERGGNIIHSDQHTTDFPNGAFFMRIEFALDALQISAERFEGEFSAIASRFQMQWNIQYTSQIKRMGIFVSKEPHCLLDLLWRWKAGELAAAIPLIISNHPNLKPIADDFGIPFHCVPSDLDTKEAQENYVLGLIKGHVDFLVLARYMQVLSDALVSQYPNQIINIHHSFLPAFAGAKPYQQAYTRGVKIIGATAHYVTAQLDEGPIIEQDVIRVTHRDGMDQLREKGRDIERTVLARAIRWHLEARVIAYENKTIVFG